MERRAGSSTMRWRMATFGCAWLLGMGAALTGCGASEDEPPTAGLAPMASASSEGRNAAPVLRSVRIDPMQPVAGSELRAVVSAHDPDGDPLEFDYAWRIDGVLREADGPSLVLSGVAPGTTVEVEVVVRDGVSESGPETARARVVDRAPVLEGLGIAPPRTVHPGDRIVVTPLASDPEGDAVEFLFEWRVNGEAVDADGPSFQTTGLRQGDRVRVRVVATDGRNQSPPLESEDVVVGGAHPEIVSTPPGMNEDGVFRYQIEARDPDGDRNLRYSLEEGPEGMTLDPVLGGLEWRPRTDQVGVHPVKVVVSDSSKLETRQSFQVTVGRTGEEPKPAAAAPDADAASGGGP